MREVRQDITRFFKTHWLHILIGIPAAVAFTALHELAHCVGVWLQGGTVTEFVWLPSEGEWGHMRFVFPVGSQYSSSAISVAPYVCWLTCCVLAVLVSIRSRPWPFWFASTTFVWLFIAPVADIANAAAPYMLLNANNDFRRAFGPIGVPVFAALAISALLIAALGYPLQRRLYRDRAIGLGAYCVLAMAGAVFIVGLTSV